MEDLKRKVQAIRNSLMNMLRGTRGMMLMTVQSRSAKPISTQSCELPAQRVSPESFQYEGLASQFDIQSCELTTQRVWPESFQYEGLASQFDTIRLIKVKRSNLGNPIECSLQHVSSLELLRLPIGDRYKAVSYEWHMKVERETARYRRRKILVNGSTSRVNRNLYDFLKAWRSLPPDAEQADSWLWIDAISLDQGNDFEKNHQIQRMKTIFGDADEVVAWLGHGSRGTERALRFDIQSFKTIARLSYWKRLWIVQELAIAKKACLMYGSSQVDWETYGIHLAKSCAVRGIESDEAVRTALGVDDTTLNRGLKKRDFWDALRNDDTTLNHGLKKRDFWDEQIIICRDVSADFDHEKRIGWGIEREISMIFGYWKMQRSMNQPSLKNLLFSFEDSECARWQDHIYALLGLAQDGHKFPVDYLESRESLRERVLRAFGPPEEVYERDYEGGHLYMKIILDRTIGTTGADDDTDGKLSPPGSAGLVELKRGDVRRIWTSSANNASDDDTDDDDTDDDSDGT